ncbi:MAG: amino acid adenylation domain-containing protein [Pseudomonadota bacterium]
MHAVHEYFFDAVVKCPEKTAIRWRSADGWADMSYADLGLRVRQLSGWCVSLGVGAGDSVGLICIRQPDTIAAIIAIMSLGARYVPIDPAYPEERIEAMVALAKVRQVVGGASELTAATLPGSVVPHAFPNAGETAFEPPNIDVPANTDAYVMFTSGSTGEPKGVAVPHDAIIRLVIDADYLAYDESMRWLVFSPFSFDASTLELWGALLHGGTCVLYPADRPINGSGLREVIGAQSVSHAWLTASLFNALVDRHVDALAPLKAVLTGGEVASMSHIRKALDALPQTDLINCYGPTENTTFTTCYRVPRVLQASLTTLPIGTPINGTGVMIVNRDLQPVAPGEAGELLALGRGLASGYVGNAALTDEKFVQVKQGDGTSVRAYRTGDRVCERDDGQLAFLGRFDDQVKIEGHRIEPGDIEAVVKQLGGVRDARVIARHNSREQLRLIAYIAGDETKVPAEIKRELEARLPRYLVPHYIVLVERFPTNANGKADIAQLPNPLAPEQAQQITTADAPDENLIADCWMQVLGHASDAQTNFFDAGGTSLDAMALQEALQSAVASPLTPTFVFEYPTIAKQVAALADNPTRRTAAVHSRNDTDGIAVIGMAGRFPGADSVEAFWRMIVDGEEGVTHFAADDIDPDIPAAMRDAPNYVRTKGVISDADCFDAAFFGVPPMEARIMDPQQRISLQVCWHALEDAAIVAENVNGRIGVYAGSNWNRYRNTQLRGTEIESRYGEFNTALANEADFLATRIAYKLNLRGPSVTLSTACSTSLVAIAEACKALRLQDCDIALAGGVSIATPLNAGYLYQEGSMLSRDGHCRSFDADATGTTFNDGAAYVVLKRVEDALIDGDRIYAVVKGTGINNDGADKVSFTAPSVEGQAGAVQRALQDANVDPATIGLIETHGTATPMGDPIEVAALKRAFSDAPQSPYCAIGSVKSNIGHLVHAAGAAGFIKAALSVYHSVLPPTLFFERENPRLELAQSPFFVNARLQSWPQQEAPRRAGISSFGVGGTNAHVIIEQAPEPSEATVNGSLAPNWLGVSAKTADALNASLAAFTAWSARNVTAPLDSVRRVLLQGRMPFDQRAAWVAEPDRLGPEGAAMVLRGDASTTREAGFLFTGQGSQRPGMGTGLAKTDTVFGGYWQRGLDYLREYEQLDLEAVLRDAASDVPPRITRTEFAQPALYLFEYAMARTLMARGLQPSVMIGHSIGEFAAAAIADVFDFEVGLGIVTRRGALMQAQPAGSMLAVFTDEVQAAEYLDDDLSLAAVNAPGACVLSGPSEAIEDLCARLNDDGLKYRAVQTSHAFHSAMMDPAAEAFGEYLADIELRAPRIPIISTVTGQRLTDAEATDTGYWAGQLRQPVRFAAAIDSAAQAQALAMIEVGPGKALTTLAGMSGAALAVHASTPEAALDNHDVNAAELAAAFGWVNGVAGIDNVSPSIPQPVNISLPGYAFERERHWVDRQASAVSPPDIAANNIFNSPTTVVEQTMSSEAHRAHLIERIINVLEDISGFGLEDSDPASEFTDLGFDSILLTQASLSIQQEFDVEVTFRQLMEDYTSIDALADMLAPQVPAPTVSVEQPVAAIAAPAAMTLPALDASAAAPLSGDIQSLIQAQLQLMQQQLALMSGGTSVNTAPVASPSIAATQAPAATPSQPDKAAPAKPSKGPGTRIKKASEGKALTKAQQSFVTQTIEQYVAATQASKDYVTEHRQIMADPRTVSGFNPQWKEMVYPIVTKASKGSTITDIDGRDYIDITNGFGPILFGHSPDFVTEAVLAQIEQGIETGPQSPLAGEVAKLCAELTGNERIAFASTGSEAVCCAIRLARTVTGRQKVVVFEGAYHGIFDEVVVRPGREGVGLPAAPGIPREMTANMLVLPWGDDASLERIRGMADELAAVMVEPVQSRNPGVQPAAFLKSLRSITEQSGSALIFDEIVTGFRVAPGGAQEYFGIRADLASYGKVIGGGYPIGVIGGKSRFMDALDGGQWQFGDDSVPQVGVTFFAGTFVRHPVALAAAKAVLLKLKQHGGALQQDLEQKTSALVAQLSEFLEALSCPVTVRSFASYFYISVPEEASQGGLLFYLMRLHGIHTWEYRPCFLTTSHSEADIAAIVAAFKQSVGELIRHGLLPGDAVALERLNKAQQDEPPVPGARLGKDEQGRPAWFIEDPSKPGKYKMVGHKKIG